MSAVIAPSSLRVGALVGASERTDADWETYIRNVTVQAAIIERGTRWFEFYQWCTEHEAKQGGSRFAEFAKERFGYDKTTAAKWVQIGKCAPELLRNAKQFSPDYTAVYAYTRLNEDDKAALAQCPVIGRKQIAGLKVARREADITRQRTRIASTPSPDGLYDVIVIDPPWAYGTKFDPTARRVANPYPEMAQDALLKIDVPAAPNSVLFLWTTHRFMWDAKALMDYWSFKYRATLVWDKESIGTGSLFRMQCEFCLVGIRGKPMFAPAHDVRDIIREPRREHSRKPDAFYALVDRLTVGRKLDYFSREPRDGWTSFGNDTKRFAA